MNTETSTTAPKSAREAHERARAEAVAHSASGRRPLIDARRGGFKPNEEAVDYRLTSALFD